METTTASFEEGARALLRRMTSMGIDADLSIKVMSFWVWLETSKGCNGIIGKIFSLGEDKEQDVLSLVIEEAKLVLSFLKNPNGCLKEVMSLKITPGLAPRFISWGSLLADKKGVMNGIREVYNGLAKSAIFEDIIDVATLEENEFDGDKHRPYYGHSNAVSSSSLNPRAKEWYPMRDRAPEGDRSLFITFSNGYPLDERQIAAFFTEKYGECVEKVYVHWPEREDGNHRACRMPPLFGKVVFKASYFPAVVLGGQNEVKFMVHKKALWCKKFEQQKKNRNF